MRIWVEIYLIRMKSYYKTGIGTLSETILRDDTTPSRVFKQNNYLYASETLKHVRHFQGSEDIKVFNWKLRLPVERCKFDIKASRVQGIFLKGGEDSAI